MIMINAKAQPLQDRWKKCGENNLEIYKDKLTACVQKVKRNIDIIGEASPGECIIDGQYIPFLRYSSIRENQPIIRFWLLKELEKY